jgi:hypothetical protein
MLTESGHSVAESECCPPGVPRMFPPAACAAAAVGVAECSVAGHGIRRAARHLPVTADNMTAMPSSCPGTGVAERAWPNLASQPDRRAAAGGTREGISRDDPDS